MMTQIKAAEVSKTAYTFEQYLKLHQQPKYGNSHIKCCFKEANTKKFQIISRVKMATFFQPFITMTVSVSASVSQRYVTGSEYLKVSCQPLLYN